MKRCRGRAPVDGAPIRRAAAATSLGCILGACLLLSPSSTFVLDSARVATPAASRDVGRGRLAHVRGGRVACGASGSTKEPWKPLVFKMPRTKPKRVAAPGDDMQQFTLDMRERLKGLKLKEEKAAGEERAVSETKVDDLIAKEADDAKINGLYAMWFIDKTRDRIKEETERPDVQVLRERFDEHKRRLDGQPAAVPSASAKSASAPAAQRGFLELYNTQDLDALVQAAEAAPPKPKAKKEPIRFALPSEGDAATEEDDDGIVEFLEQVQKQTQIQDRVSKRVVKSPEKRRQDYEDTKLAVTASTAALGVAGSVVSLVQYGADAALGFGLGSVGALLYLSGLSQYADNAESPMAQASGGRRLLVPVILVLIVANWEKLCFYVPALAASGLQPELLPLLAGFFTYVLGKIIGGMIKA